MVTYEKGEKQAILEEYKRSGRSLKGSAEEKGILASTLQGWIKDDKNLIFGAIEVNSSNPPLPRTIKPAIIFSTEKMRIELKEGFDKELLKSIVGVLLHD